MRKKRVSDPLICSKCGKIDRSDWNRGYVGTSKKMKCEDCAGESGFARLCRECCPTRHGILVSEIRGTDAREE